MSTTTPSARDLVRLLDPQTVAHLLNLSARLDRPTVELTLLLEQAAQAQRDRGEASGQLEFDLSGVGPAVVTPCMSPPPEAFPDLAVWLRAGGGRSVNATCNHSCPCGGTSPWGRATPPDAR